MAHRSDECTTRQEIAQAVSFAEMMDTVENAYLNLSQLVNVFYLSHRRLGASEQPLLEERADAEDVGSDDAETNNHQSQEYGKEDIDYEIMGIALEELAYVRQVGHEQEMDEIDVERPSANIL